MKKERLEITRCNELYVPGSGFYNMKNAHWLERTVAKLGLLAVVCNHTADDLSKSGENLTILGPEIEALADKLYKIYKPAVENGHDVFGLDRFWDKRNAVRYAHRPILNGYANASPEERTDGLPDGWWYNHSGFVTKMFEDQFVVVSDIDDRVCMDILDPSDAETLQCIRYGDYSKVTDSVDCSGNFVSTLKTLLPEDVCVEVRGVVDFFMNLRADTKSQSVADKVYARIGEFQTFVTTYLTGDWHLERTGRDCWVAYVEVTLKTGDTVSLGVDAEYVVLYACKWDEDEDGAEKPLFIWEPKDGTDSLNSELKNHLEDSNLANALLGNALAVMHSRFF